MPIFSRHKVNSDTVKSVVSAVMRHKLSKQTGEFIDALKKRVETVGAFNMFKVKSTTVDSVPGPCVGKQTEDDYQVKEVLQDVFVYSAFLDERNNDIDAKDRNRNDIHAVRIMTVLPSRRDKKKSSNTLLRRTVKIGAILVSAAKRVCDSEAFKLQIRSSHSVVSPAQGVVADSAMFRAYLANVGADEHFALDQSSLIRVDSSTQH